PETPNVLGVYLLSRVLAEYRRLGIESIRKETERKASLIYSTALECDRLGVYVSEEAFRSATVAAIEFDGDAFWLRSELKKRGHEVGTGYLELKKTQSRIANFPMHTYEQ